VCWKIQGSGLRAIKGISDRQTLITCLVFFLSGLPQQREHCEQRLEDPQHSEEQVVRLHGKDTGGKAGMAGGHFKGERKTEK